MNTHIHTVEGNDYQLNIGKGVTELVSPFNNGLKYRYKLVIFNANEEEKEIKVIFNRQLVTIEDETIINQERVGFTLSDWDYNYFEDTLGIPTIKSSILDGLLKYHLQLPKYFNPVDDEPVIEPTDNIR